VLLIFGFRNQVVRLAAIALLCQVCGNRAAHIVYKLVTRFTLFFVPTFPISTYHKLQCTACGVSQVISKEMAAQYQQQAAVPIQV